MVENQIAVESKSITSETFELKTQLLDVYAAACNLERKVCASNSNFKNLLSDIPFNMDQLALRISSWVELQSQQHKVQFKKPRAVSPGLASEQVLEVLLMEGYVYMKHVECAAKNLGITFTPLANPTGFSRAPTSLEYFFSDSRIQNYYNIKNSEESAKTQNVSTAPGANEGVEVSSQIPAPLDTEEIKLPLLPDKAPDVGITASETRVSSIVVSENIQAHTFPSRKNAVKARVQGAASSGTHDRELRNGRASNPRAIRENRAPIEVKKKERSASAKKDFSSDTEKTSGSKRRNPPALKSVATENIQLRTNSSFEVSPEGSALTHQEKALSPNQSAKHEALLRALADMQLQLRETRLELLESNSTLQEAQQLCAQLTKHNRSLEHTNQEQLRTWSHSTEEHKRKDSEIQKLQNAVRQLSGDKAAQEKERADNLEREVATLKRQLELASDTIELRNQQIEVLRVKVKAQEFFQLETLKIIQEAAADGRLIDLLNPQRIVELLAKLDQVKTDLKKGRRSNGEPLNDSEVVRDQGNYVKRESA